MKVSVPFVVVCALLLAGGGGAYCLLHAAPASKSLARAAGTPVEEPPVQKKGQATRPKGETYEVEITEYRPQPSPWDDLLADDRLEDKRTTFDPERVHPRAVDGWQINLSAAVLGLDVPMLKPDVDQKLLELHPSYAAAMAEAQRLGGGWQAPLPSANLIDGLAKQFDDGLYAALDQAYYQGLDETLTGHVALVRRVFERLGPDSPASPFLAAALELAGQPVKVADEASKRSQLQEFLGNEVRSKPIGVYTWNPTLERCFRFLRFLQRPMEPDDPAARAIMGALADDEALRADYEKANAFYAKLTNPLKRGTLTAPGGSERIAFFPASTSREGELFEALFPLGLPPDANLMRELITRIRSGNVSLEPSAKSGWYGYQIYALETLLLPEKGAEHDKLLLTKGYKRRMLEAFQALLTKRRETHVRQLDVPMPMSAAPIQRERLRVAPMLRLEPALTFYLRTARAYAFLADFLHGAVGESALKTLHGLRASGPREADLDTELRDMRDRFYGFYLLGCEDIGMEPALLADEPVDRARAIELATAWLESGWKSDADLSADTRVAVPIYYDSIHNVTRLWVTLGVRLARLEAHYARPPQARPGDSGDWQELRGDQLQGKTYLIAVDEFAEIELPGARVLSRDELRALCDQAKTREAILKALER
jgi:hypothetical protein